MVPVDRDSTDEMKMRTRMNRLGWHEMTRRLDDAANSPSADDGKQSIHSNAAWCDVGASDG